jgi:hypothetical protein
MLQRITLHLGRCAAYPEGSDRHGYEITAPLDADGHVDPLAWQEQRELCRVRRFWAGEPDRHGWLVHRAGGSGGATWVIDYDDATSEDDETAYRLDKHRFAVDEYVSIRDADSDIQTFKVVGVRPAGKISLPYAKA